MSDWKEALPPKVRGAILRNQARYEVLEAINYDGSMSDSISADGRMLMQDMEIIDMAAVRQAIGEIN